ncbi:MAG TPA: hypothetical protein VIY49_14360 [Bryobacteraceae bacterium]
MNIRLCLPQVTEEAKHQENRVLSYGFRIRLRMGHVTDPDSSPSCSVQVHTLKSRPPLLDQTKPSRIHNPGINAMHQGNYDIRISDL